MKIVCFLGYSGSGKTTAITRLTRLLVERGKRVGVLKHIGGGHTLADPSKDTGKFVSAGAHTVAALADEGLYLYRKTQSLGEALSLLEDASIDYLFVEGFSRDPQISSLEAACVICARTSSDAEKLLSEHKNRNIKCVVSLSREGFGEKELSDVPVLIIPEDEEKVASLVLD